MGECGLRLHLPLQEFVALGQHPVHVSQSGSGEVLQGGRAISGADNDAALPRQNKKHPAVASLGNQQTKIRGAHVIGEDGVNLRRKTCLIHKSGDKVRDEVSHAGTWNTEFFDRWIV